MDLLELLGEWETEDGKLIVPEDLENIQLNEIENDDT